MLNMMSFLRTALDVHVGVHKGVASEGEGAGRCLEAAWNVGTWMIGCMMSREVYCTFGS